MKVSAQAINLVIDENFSGKFSDRLHAKRLKKKIVRLEKEGRLTTRFLEAEGEEQQEWAYRIFAANMMLKDYSWWGWECRSRWAWELANQRWFYPRWNGKPGKLLVVAEQGIGDEILFASCARELAAINPDVHWEIDSRLIPVMTRSIPEVNWITRWKSLRSHGDHEPYQLSDYRGEYDAFIPAGNVPKLFRTSGAFPRTPYLVPKTRDRDPRWGFVSQAGAAQEKQTDYHGLGDVNLHHSLILDDVDNVYPDDFDDFIDLVASLEGVNAVPSAVVHLCGALGQRCNVIMPPKFTGKINTVLKWYYRPGTMDWYGDHVQVFRSRKEFDDRANHRPR